MHLRVRALQVLIEFFLLVIAQDFADLLVGIHPQRPDLTKELFVRRAFALYEVQRGIMQFLQDGFDFGLLIDGEIKLLGQHLQLISDVWQDDALGGAFSGLAGRCGLLRQHSWRNQQHTADCK